MDRQRASVVRVSSQGRGWAGFEAFITDTSAGLTQSAPSANHRICMHLGPAMQSTVECDGRIVRRLQVAGNLDVVPPPAFASWHDEGAGSILAMRMQPSLLDSVSDAIGVPVTDALPEFHVRDARIEHVAWALAAELQSAHPVGRAYAESLSIALCMQLLRRYARPPSRPAVRSIPARRLQRAIDYIQEHLDEDLSLMHLAEIAGMSPSHFKVLFKRSTGAAVHQYILKARVDLAVRLIELDRVPLREIAAQAGFADQSHMSRWVRRLTGRSPSVLRGPEM